MKLAAIYNVWDGVELLEGSIECIAKHVDHIIIVYQTLSNYGELLDPQPMLMDLRMKYPQIQLRAYSPQIGSGATNERNKRNIGLRMALDLDCTHFLHMDCDEYYYAFEAAKAAYLQCGCEGSAVGMYTYFGKKEWRFEHPDNYYVPFIHRLKPSTRAGISTYPVYVDPTRRINTVDVAVLSSVMMHHYSWVRDDIERKIRNSSAKNNIMRSQLLNDYRAVMKLPDASGYYVKDFRQELIIV